jgi:putative lipoic acid-binding regulatory protein
MDKHFSNKNNNGNGKGEPPFGNKKVEYPVTFALKAVMDVAASDDENKKRITRVFLELDIVHSFENKRASSKGNYTSFTYLVTLTGKKQLIEMYGKLKNVEGLKFAL